MLAGPTSIPKRRLASGALMPAIGMGTFGSDHVSADEVAAAVEDALAFGYRPIDCASVDGSEPRIGDALAAAFRAGLRREEVWIVSKLWNDKHAENDVIPQCRQS